jgi:hypothetical protein
VEAASSETAAQKAEYIADYGLVLILLTKALGKLQLSRAAAVQRRALITIRQT